MLYDNQLKGMQMLTIWLNSHEWKLTIWMGKIDGSSSKHHNKTAEQIPTYFSLD